MTTAGGGMIVASGTCVHWSGRREEGGWRLAVMKVYLEALI